MTSQDEELTWEDSFAIALRLMDTYPKIAIEQVGYRQLLDMVVALPAFADDPTLANDDILEAILSEWLEESDA